MKNNGQTITNSINETNDFLTNTNTTTNTTLEVIPFEPESDSTYNEINDFVTYFPRKINEAISSMNQRAAKSYTFHIPIINYDLTLYSDMISRYIVNTTGYAVINTFIGFYWFWLFGGRTIKKIKRIYDWFASGGMLQEGGLIRFSEVLKGENEFFNQFMM